MDQLLRLQPAAGRKPFPASVLVQHPCLAPLDQRFEAAMALLPAVLVSSLHSSTAVSLHTCHAAAAAQPAAEFNYAMQGCGQEQEWNIRIALAGFLGRILFQWKVVIGHAAIDALSKATSERVSMACCYTAAERPLEHAHPQS